MAWYSEAVSAAAGGGGATVVATERNDLRFATQSIPQSTEGEALRDIDLQLYSIQIMIQIADRIVIYDLVQLYD